MKKNFLTKLLSVFCAVAIAGSTMIASFSNAFAVTVDHGPSTAKQVSDEGIVLLENDNVLPLAKGTKVAVFGGAQNNWQYQSSGAAAIVPGYVVTFMDALEESDNLILNQAVRQAYGSSSDEIALTDELLDQAVEDADLAMITIARSSGENADHVAKKGDYYLSDEEAAMIDAVTDAFEQVVVILNIGTVMDTSWIAEYGNIDGVLLVYFPGMEGGYSAVDVLTGAINPSGRLTDTFAKDYFHYPSAYNFGHPTRTSGQNGTKHDFNFETGESASWTDVYYGEDIYVGYRYFETFGIDVMYPFGYGLSYTEFDQSVENFSTENGKVSFDVVVKNVGGRAGKDVVQVYYSAPEGVIEKPTKELVAFGKTDIIENGQTDTVHISFDISDMASYDEEDASYVLEKGTYEIMIGENVHDTEVIGTYQLNSDTVTEELTNQYDIPEEYKLNVLSQKDIEDNSALIASPELIEQYVDNESGPANFHPDIYNLEGLAEKRIEDDGLDTSMDDYAAQKTEDPYMFSDLLKGNVTLEDFVLQMTDLELATFLVGTGWGNGNAGDTAIIERLGIPIFATADGDSGVAGSNTLGNRRYSTGFPCSTMMACTWNMELIEEVGRVIGEEAYDGNVDLMLAPAINLHRNPLCGRNPEYCSEDPLISGKNAAAIINGIQSRGVGATMKHFAVNNQESMRKAANAIVSERALREIYLKGFEIGIKEAQPWSVMTSYNPINGTYTANSYDLVHNILRGEWGFEGFVMTDFEGWEEQVKSQLVGNEWTTPGISSEITMYQEAMADGILPRCIARANVAKMLGVFLKSPTATGMAFTIESDDQIELGETMTASVSIDEEMLEDVPDSYVFVWSSINDDNMELISDAESETAIFMANQDGNALIQAKVYGVFGQETVFLGAAKKDVISGKMVRMSGYPDDRMLVIGESVTVNTAYIATGSYFTTVNYQSSDPNVISITSSGNNAVLTAVAEGEATISVNVNSLYPAYHVGMDSIDLKVVTEKPVSYTITALNTDDVVINLPKTTATAGEEVSFTVTVDGEQEIDRVTVYGEDGNYTRVLIANDSVYTFTMPEENVTIEVQLKETGLENLNTNFLEYIISIADNYIANGDLDDVIASAKAELYTAYNNAKDVLAKAQADPAETTQTKINEAACDLLATFQYLELKADKEMLRMLIDLADSILENADSYIPNSISGLKAVVDEAKAVESSDEVTNKEINQMVIKLIDEIYKARLRPDKSALAGLVVQMKALDSKLYTANSFTALITTVTTGETVLEDENADADEVNDAVKAIQLAYARLEKLSKGGSESPSSSGSGSSSEPSGNNGNGSNGLTSGSVNQGVGNSPKTGDMMPVFVIVLAVLGIGTVLVTKKRKADQ